MGRRRPGRRRSPAISEPPATAAQRSGSTSDCLHSGCAGVAASRRRGSLFFGSDFNAGDGTHSGTGRLPTGKRRHATSGRLPVHAEVACATGNLPLRANWQPVNFEGRSRAVWVLLVAPLASLKLLPEEPFTGFCFERHIEITRPRALTVPRTRH